MQTKFHVAWEKRDLDAGHVFSLQKLSFYDKMGDNNVR
jgi:hypothetical protein